MAGSLGFECREFVKNRCCHKHPFKGNTWTREKLKSGDKDKIASVLEQLSIAVTEREMNQVVVDSVEVKEVCEVKSMRVEVKDNLGLKLKLRWLKHKYIPAPCLKSEVFEISSSDWGEDESVKEKRCFIKTDGCFWPKRGLKKPEPTVIKHVYGKLKILSPEEIRVKKIKDSVKLACKIQNDRLEAIQSWEQHSIDTYQDDIPKLRIKHL